MKSKIDLIFAGNIYVLQTGDIKLALTDSPEEARTAASVLGYNLNDNVPYPYQVVYDTEEEAVEDINKVLELIGEAGLPFLNAYRRGDEYKVEYMGFVLE